MKTTLFRLIRGLALWLQRYQPLQPEHKGLVVPIPLRNEFDRLQAIETERLPHIVWHYDCGLRRMKADDMQVLFGQASPVELFPLLFASWIFFLQRIPKGETIAIRYSTLREEGGRYWIQVKKDATNVFAVHSTTPLEDIADTLVTIGEHHGFRFHREQAEEKGFRIVLLNRPQPEAAEVQTATTVAVA
ncbi:MAG: hypothetical protein AAB767_01430 [Patescibacteria group bacterium]